MTCLGCAERAKLLAEARAAVQRGDHSAVSRIMREMFGTAIKDFNTLRSISFVTKDAQGQRHTDRIDLKANPPESEKVVP